MAYHQTTVDISVQSLQMVSRGSLDVISETDAVTAATLTQSLMEQSASGDVVERNMNNMHLQDNQKTQRRSRSRNNSRQEEPSLESLANNLINTGQASQHNVAQPSWASLAEKARNSPVTVEPKRTSTSTSDTTSRVYVSRFIQDELKNFRKSLILMRGVPGSGKSSLAKKISDEYGAAITSADFYFYNSQGVYFFDRDRLTEAHDYCFKETMNYAEANMKLIIVDNTNLEVWEMLRYAKIAKDYKYHLMLVEPLTPWKYDAKKCARYNNHGVTRESIENCLARFDRRITAYGLMQKLESKERSDQFLSRVSAPSLVFPSRAPPTVPVTTAKPSSLSYSKRQDPPLLSSLYYKQTVAATSSDGDFHAVPPSDLYQSSNNGRIDDRMATSSSFSSPSCSDDKVGYREEASPKRIDSFDRTSSPMAKKNKDHFHSHCGINWSIPSFPNNDDDDVIMTKLVEDGKMVRNSSAQTEI